MAGEHEARHHQTATTSIPLSNNGNTRILSKFTKEIVGLVASCEILALACVNAERGQKVHLCCADDLLKVRGAEAKEPIWKEPLSYVTSRSGKELLDESIDSFKKTKEESPDTEGSNKKKCLLCKEHFETLQKCRYDKIFDTSAALPEHKQTLHTQSSAVEQ